MKRENNSKTFHFSELCLKRKDLPLIIQRVHQTDTLHHTHDFFELVFILEGSAEHIVGKKRYELNPNDFFLIDNKMRHSYKNCRSLKLINILIRDKFLISQKKILSPIKGYKVLFSHIETGTFIQPPPLEHDSLKECLYLINKIEKEEFELCPRSNKMLSILFLELMITVCRKAAEKNKNTEKNFPQLDNVLTYIQNHYMEDIDLERLCKKTYMSKRSFLRYFHKITGYSPIQYLLKIRISKACRLLRESDIPLREIATLCGFKNNNYFSRCFKKITGLQPKQFKNKTSI